MRHVLIYVDLVTSRASSGLFLVITVLQVKAYGVRHWAKWGYGAGVLRDSVERVEQEAIDQIRNADKEIVKEVRAVEE